MRAYAIWSIPERPTIKSIVFSADNIGKFKFSTSIFNISSKFGSLVCVNQKFIEWKQQKQNMFSYERNDYEISLEPPKLKNMKQATTTETNDIRKKNFNADNKCSYQAHTPIHCTQAHPTSFKHTRTHTYLALHFMSTATVDRSSNISFFLPYSHSVIYHFYIASSFHCRDKARFQPSFFFCLQWLWWKAHTECMCYSSECYHNKL